MEKAKEFFHRYSVPERDQLTVNVVSALRGVHESLGCVSEDLRNLEEELDGVLYGKSFGEMLHDFREEVQSKDKAE